LPSLTPRIDSLNSYNNLIIGGNFDFWQRGTSVTGLNASTTYLADRFLLRTAGTTAVYRMDRSTDVPTYAQSGFQSLYSLAVQCTTLDSSVGAADNVSVEHRLEGYDYAQIASGAPFRIQFWVKSVLAGVYCFSMVNSAGNRCYVKEYTLPSNTWTKISIDLNSDTSGTWLLDNGRGILFRWALMSGTDNQAAANSWQAGSAYSTSNQVNFSSSTSNIFYITQVSLIAGSFGANDDLPFKRAGRTIQQELAMCQRYCFKSQTGFAGMGQAVTSTQVMLIINHPVPLRQSPTEFAYSGFNTINASNGVGISSVTWTLSAETAFPNSLASRLIGTGTGAVVAGNASIVYSTVTGTDFFLIGAEL